MLCSFWKECSAQQRNLENGILGQPSHPRGRHSTTLSAFAFQSKIATQHIFSFQQNHGHVNVHLWKAKCVHVAFGVGKTIKVLEHFSHANSIHALSTVCSQKQSAISFLGAMAWLGQFSVRD